jgi:hypothetical protein
LNAPGKNSWCNPNPEKIPGYVAAQSGWYIMFHHCCCLRCVPVKIILANYKDLIYDLCRWLVRDWYAVLIGNMIRVSALVPYSYV